MIKTDQFRKDVGNKLIIFRAALSLTQKDVCDALDMYQSHYSRIEKGEYSITLYKAYRLFELYGLNIYWLLGYDPKMIDERRSKKLLEEEIISLREQLKSKEKKGSVENSVE